MVDRSDRRTVLRSGVTCCTLAVAGCLGFVGGDEEDPGDGRGGDDDGEGSASDDESEEPDPDDGSETGSDENAEPEPGDGSETEDGTGAELPTSVDTWPMFQYDAQNTGAVEVQTPEGRLEERWRRGLGDGINVPAVATGEAVFVPTASGVVYALDGERGTTLWEFDTGGGVGESPAIFEDLLLVPNEHGVTALAIDDGSEVWSHETQHHPTPITVAGDHAYFGDNQQWFYALEASTGEEEWSWDGVHNEHHFMQAPAVSGEYVFAGAAQRDLYRFDRDTGEEEPLLFRSDEPGLSVAPTIADGALVAGGFDGNVYAYEGLDSVPLTQRWHERPGGEIIASPASDGTHVVVLFEDAIRCYDLESGDVLWTDRLEANSTRQGPVIFGEVVSITNSSADGPHLITYEIKSGERSWTKSLDFVVPASPIIQGRDLVVPAMGRGVVVRL